LGPPTNSRGFGSVSSRWNLNFESSIYSVGVLPAAFDSPLDRAELRVGFEPFVRV
jgi:hypothetical protein